MITVEDLMAICGMIKRIPLLDYVGPLNAAMTEFHISETIDREAAFIAQIVHESGGFRYVRELASGEAYENRVVSQLGV